MAKIAKTLTLDVLIEGLKGIKNATETETRYSILDSWSALDRVQEECTDERNIDHDLFLQSFNDN